MCTHLGGSTKPAVWSSGATLVPVLFLGWGGCAEVRGPERSVFHATGEQ